MSALIFATSLLIIVNLVGLFFFRWVYKNKYKVGDYVYMTSDGCHLELAEIVFIEWHISCDNIVSRPIYTVNFIEGEHKGYSKNGIAENDIFCKFKGERLIPSE